MTDPEVRLAAIHQRRAAITRPPWKTANYSDDQLHFKWQVTTGPRDPRYPNIRWDLTDEMEQEDAEFIAHAPEDITWLLLAHDRLTSMLAERVRQVDQLKDLLRRLEWRGCVEHFECPACGQRENKGGHDPECWLWLAIRSA